MKLILPCLAGIGFCVWWLTHTSALFGGLPWPLMMGGAWVLFALAVYLIRRVKVKAATALIILGGIGLALAAGFTAPQSSDDLYRYIWDGRVQAAGVSAYRHAPADPALVGLRDEFLWPRHSNWCLPDGSCTMINRPTVHTIYPPVAQVYFVGVHHLSPANARERPIQLAAMLFAVATTVLLVLALPRVGLDPRLAALWAWCPLVALETGNTAHIDVVGAFLAALALLAVARGKPVLGGVFLGLAVATKVSPALIGPALLRRRGLAVIAGAAGAIATVYLPHVLAVGPGVLGYIPGYLSEEGYSSGSRFALLTMVLPHEAAPVAAALILTVTAVAVWRVSDPDRPWRSAIVMVGVALLVTTPSYAWYATLLILLVAFTNRPEWLAVAVAGYVAQYSANLALHGIHAQRLGYGLAAALVLTATLTRHLRGDECPGRELNPLPSALEAAARR